VLGTLHFFGSKKEPAPGVLGLLQIYWKMLDQPGGFG